MTEPLFELEGVVRRYPGGPFWRPRTDTAVDGVDLTIGAGVSLGVVGESGSGKSTLLRMLLALDAPDAGVVRYRGRPLRVGDPGALRRFRREVQVVFQDPRGSLDPRWPVGRSIAEPLVCLGVPGDHRVRVAEVLSDVELDADAADRYPHQFSGGQCQRIALARALAPGPRVLVGDEPVSSLDVATRETVLDLLARLVGEHDLTLVLVSHDLGVVRRVCAEVAVLHAGRIVEHGPTTQVLARPEHVRTRALVDAVPRLPA